MNHAVQLLQRRWQGVCFRALLALALSSLLSQTITAAQLASSGVQADLQSEAQLAAAVIAADTDEQRRALVTAQPNLVNQWFRHTLAMQVLRLQMKGEHERVLAVLAFARKLAEERQDKGWIAMTWIDSAGSLELVGRRSEATAAAFKTQNVKPFEQDKMALAHVEGTQAFVALLSGQASLRAVARQKALHSLTIFAPEQRLEIALAHCVLGMLEVRNAESEIAPEYLQKSIRLFEEMGDRFWLTIPFNYLGEYYHYRGDHLRAIPYLQQSVEISEEFGIHFLLYYTTNLLGNSYSSLGDTVGALQSYEKSLQERVRLGDKRKIAVILGSLASLYLDQQRYEKAYEYTQRAIQFSIESNDPKMISGNYRTLAIVNAFQGNPKLEMEALEKSLAIAQAAGDHSEITSALIRLGNAYGEREDYPRTLAMLQQARQMAGTALTVAQNLELLSVYGRVYFFQRDWDKALSYYQEILKINEKFYRPGAHTEALRRIGEIYSARGDPQQALHYFELAQPIIEKNRIQDAGVSVAMGKAYYTLKQPDKAIEHFELALTMAEQWHTRLTNPDWHSWHIALSRIIYDDYIEVLMDLHRNHPTAGYAAKALQVSEQGRARGLLDLLAETRHNLRHGVNEVLLEQERELQRQIAGKSAQLIAASNKAQAAPLQSEIAKLTVELNQIEAQIRVASPNYAALTRPQPLTTAQIQQQVLDSDTLLLAYHLGKEKSWLWVVTPEEVTSFQLPPRAEIEAVARRVRDLLIAPPAKATATVAYEVEAESLSRMILGPVAEKLGQKRLVIVADGILQYLPFAALPEPVVGDRWSVVGKKQIQSPTASHQPPLMVKHEIVTLPSASALAVLRRETVNRTPAPQTVAVLADPVFRADDVRVKARAIASNVAVLPEKSLSVDAAPLPLQQALRGMRDGLPRLRFSRDEANAIAAIAPAATRLIALDFQANRDIATKGDLSQYRMLHFATHGLLNSEQPELSGLVLSLVDQQGNPQDGFWRLHEIYNLKLKADLVVLSACQTGLGKEVKGEGLIGLTRGFMYAGAPRVVASLWQVDDVATAELMKRFYRGMLQQGQRPAAALRAAQLEMRSKKQWQHPFYWAAFTLQGEWK